MTIDQIEAGSDEEVLALLGKELASKISAGKNSPEFLEQMRKLPSGLRAMAATYEFDVSLTLDDVGWHFGNYHSRELSEETAKGLEELGANELARIFREAYRIAQKYWEELGSENWMKWYHGSELQREVDPLDTQARALWNSKQRGIFNFWVEYARRFPERVGAT